MSWGKEHQRAFQREPLQEGLGGSRYREEIYNKYSPSGSSTETILIEKGFQKNTFGKVPVKKVRRDDNLPLEGI